MCAKAITTEWPSNMQETKDGKSCKTAKVIEKYKSLMSWTLDQQEEKMLTCVFKN